MAQTPHLDKLNAALQNPKCAKDKRLLKEAAQLYSEWMSHLNGLTSIGKVRFCLLRSGVSLLR
jgi:hypothetical protein